MPNKSLILIINESHLERVEELDDIGSSTNVAEQKLGKLISCHLPLFGDPGKFEQMFVGGFLTSYHSQCYFLPFQPCRLNLYPWHHEASHDENEKKELLDDEDHRVRVHLGERQKNRYSMIFDSKRRTIVSMSTLVNVKRISLKLKAVQGTFISGTWERSTGIWLREFVHIRSLLKEYWSTPISLRTLRSMSRLLLKLSFWLSRSKPKSGLLVVIIIVVVGAIVVWLFNRAASRASWVVSRVVSQNQYFKIFTCKAKRVSSLSSSINHIAGQTLQEKACSVSFWNWLQTRPHC